MLTVVTVTPLRCRQHSQASLGGSEGFPTGQRTWSLCPGGGTGVRSTRVGLGSIFFLALYLRYRRFPRARISNWVQRHFSMGEWNLKENAWAIRMFEEEWNREKADGRAPSTSAWDRG